MSLFFVFFYIMLKITVTSTAPMMGPMTGIHAYDQSLSPFVLIGNKKCEILGPKSRAGLIAYPVGPPNDNPIPNTSNATGNAFNVPNASVGADIDNAVNTSTNVAIISVIRLYDVLRMAGALQKTARIRSLSSVTSKCCLYASHTILLLTIAPVICAST